MSDKCVFVLTARSIIIATRYRSTIREDCLQQMATSPPTISVHMYSDAQTVDPTSVPDCSLNLHKLTYTDLLTYKLTYTDLHRLADLHRMEWNAVPFVRVMGFV